VIQESLRQTMYNQDPTTRDSSVKAPFNRKIRSIRPCFYKDFMAILTIPAYDISLNRFCVFVVLKAPDDGATGSQQIRKADSSHCS